MAKHRLFLAATCASILVVLAASGVGVAGASVAAQTAGTTSLGSPLTAMFVDGNPGALVTGGHAYSFTALTAGHVGSAATFAANQNGHAFAVSFAPLSGQPLTVGSYPNAQLTADASHPGLDLSGDGVSCSSSSGTFLVDEVSLGGNGDPLTFSARFWVQCNGDTPAVFGAVSYNATADFRTTTIPTAVDFGPVTVGQSRTLPIPITNNGPSDLSPPSLGIVAGGQGLGFSWDYGTCGAIVVLHAGESCSADVTFTPLEIAPGPQVNMFRIFDEATLAGWGGPGRLVELTATSVGWQSLGGYVNADPTAVADPLSSAGLYLFVRGGDNAVYWQHSPDGATWPGYQSAGGALSSLPFAVADPAGASGTVAVYVFGRGGDGALYVGRIVSGTWQGWQSLGGYLTSYPTATVSSTGVWVAVRGGDGALYARHLTSGGWSPWQGFGGYLDSAGHLAADPSGVYAFVAGDDDAMYVRNLSAGGGWSNLGGFITSPPVAVADATGISVFASGGDGGVYTRHLGAGTWTPYLGLGQQVISAPLPVANGDGLSVFVVAFDGRLYRNHFDGTSWGGWTTPGTFGVVSDPIPVVDGSATEHVFVIMYDDSIHTIAYDGLNGLATTDLPGPGAPTTAGAPPPGRLDRLTLPQ